jgi:hypothetical protein
MTFWSFFRQRPEQESAAPRPREPQPQPVGDSRGQYGFGRRAHEADPNSGYEFSEERPRPKFGRSRPAPIEQASVTSSQPRSHRLADFGRG